MSSSHNVATETVRPENNIDDVFGLENQSAVENEGDEVVEEDLFAKASGSGDAGNGVLRDDLKLDAKRLKVPESQLRPWKNPYDADEPEHDKDDDHPEENNSR